jgi:hypothetical protein
VLYLLSLSFSLFDFLSYLRSLPLCVFSACVLGVLSEELNHCAAVMEHRDSVAEQGAPTSPRFQSAYGIYLPPPKVGRCVCVCVCVCVRLSFLSLSHLSSLSSLSSHPSHLIISLSFLFSPHGGRFFSGVCVRSLTLWWCSASRCVGLVGSCDVCVCVCVLNYKYRVVGVFGITPWKCIIFVRM